MRFFDEISFLVGDLARFVKNRSWRFRAWILSCSYALVTIAMFLLLYINRFQYSAWFAAALPGLFVCLLGPNYSRIVDRCNHKRLSILLLLLMGGIQWCSDWCVLPYHLLCLSHILYGIMAGVVILLVYGSMLINVTPSDNRNRICMRAYRYGLGAILFALIYGALAISFVWELNIDLIPYSCCFCWLAAILLLFIRVPFRAPLGAEIWSFDRFLLLEHNRLMILIFICGISMGVILYRIEDFSLWLYVFIGSIILSKWRLRKKRFGCKYSVLDACKSMIIAFLIMLVTEYLSMWLKPLFFLSGIFLGYGFYVIYIKTLEHIFKVQSHANRSTTLVCISQLTIFGCSLGMCLAMGLSVIFPHYYWLLVIAFYLMFLALKWQDW